MSTAVERLLSRFGLAVLCMMPAAFFVAITMLYPPWLEVDCDRYMVLYFSEQREVQDWSFAGFDYLFSAEKKVATWTPPHPVSGSLFKSHEFNIWWTLLNLEWTAILIATVLVYLHVCKRMRANTEPTASQPSDDGRTN